VGDRAIASIRIGEERLVQQWPETLVLRSDGLEDGEIVNMAHDRRIVIPVSSHADERAPGKRAHLVGRRLDGVGAGDRGHLRSKLAVLCDE
jgi:hypothetical protein